MMAQTLGLFVAALCTGGVLAVLHKMKHPLVAALTSAVCGAAALGAVNLLAGFTGITIALNYATAFAAVVLGVPGVVLLLILRLLLLL